MRIFNCELFQKSIRTKIAELVVMAQMLFLVLVMIAPKVKNRKLRPTVYSKNWTDNRWLEKLIFLYR